jgi:outer membrane receptor protein involved in Fe transport
LATFQVGNPTVNNRWNSPNFYIQDEFRVSKKLTVNAGLRYQLILWPGLDQNAPFPDSRIIHTDRLDFSPRLSAGYQLTPSTTIRGAVGQYFDTPDWNVFTNISLLNGDYIKTYTFTPTRAGAPTYPNVPTAAQLLSSSVPSIATYDPTYRDMYSIQANAQVGRGLMSDVCFKRALGE